MNRRVSQIYQLLIVYQCITYSSAIEYEFLVEDNTFYSECKDMPPNVLDMNGLHDLTNLNLSLLEEGLQFSGNMTTVWSGLHRSDRIQMETSVQYWDRGTWMPTILNMLVPDICKVMFDERQVWYKPWSSHIINRKDVEPKCYKVPGTVFIFETFTARYRFGSGIPLPPNRYSLRVHFTAYDKFNKKRETEICFEMRGTFSRV